MAYQQRIGYLKHVKNYRNFSRVATQFFFWKSILSTPFYAIKETFVKTDTVNLQKFKAHQGLYQPTRKYGKSVTIREIAQMASLLKEFKPKFTSLQLTAISRSLRVHAFAT